MKQSLLLSLALGLALLIPGCGGQKTNGADAAGVDTEIHVSPSPAQATVGQSLAFKATFGLGSGYSWKVVPASLGTFSADGTFKAATAGTGIVVATWTKDTRYVGTASITTFPVPVATITASASVDANAQNLVASVPEQPGCTYHWTVEGGTLVSGDGTSQIIYTAGPSGTVHLACTVTNAIGAPAEGAKPVLVVEPPVITRWEGLPALVRPGSTTGLYAGYKGTTAVVTPGGATVADGGVLPVAPQQNTLYTLTVTNAAGTSVSASTLVLVGDPCPPPDPKAGDGWLDPATGLQMVWCPPGSFTMGAPLADADALEHERPEHPVDLGAGFWISRSKVTQAQWKAIMGANPAFFQDAQACTRFGEYVLRPVERISWEDAQGWMERLNDRVGWSAYRLPSEAEWEYAYRAGTSTVYPWSATGAGAAVFARFRDNSAGLTWSVQELAPNPWNLFDMAGDVMEWVADAYQGDYQGAPADGGAVLGLDTPYRTQRGGSWNDGLKALRASARYARPQTERSRTVGFRVARPACSAPVIWDFKASPGGTLPAAGGKVTLTWQVDGASWVRIDQGIGEVTGTSTVTVQVASGRTFVLTAGNASGWTMAAVKVEVAQ